ncbi:MAG: single-stranded DNA-binding protein [Selenomonadaceae bacterium]|nr:single-stranded DNA-binding protein [Selenomonadaceae bacterium]
MNKVFLSGNLTRDPEVRYTQSGKAYAKMGIAVRRPFTKDKDAVDFFNLTAWDRTAEFCGKYLNKGSRVLVEGRLQNSSYENKDGIKMTSTDIMVDNIEFAGSKRSEEDGARVGGEGYSNNRESYSGNRDNRDDYSNNRGRENVSSGRNTFDDGEPIDPEDTPF